MVDVVIEQGANQAVAASKLGAKVEFLFQVGDDEAGQRIIRELHNNNLEWQHAKVLKDTPTGQAFIFRFKNGENSIVIVGGANMNYEEPFHLLHKSQDYIHNSKLLLLQREIPERVNIAAAQYAKSQGDTVVLDCGGEDTKISSELLKLVDIISPNMTELQRLVGDKASNKEDSIRAIRELQKQYPNLNFLIKRGEEGGLFVKNDESAAIEVGAFSDKSLQIVDTTGAGDCYTAAFCTQYILEKPISECMKFASTAAFLSITKKGAMPSMPTLEEVEQHLHK